MRSFNGLFWKCLLQRKRNWIMSLVELICLILTAFIMHKDITGKLSEIDRIDARNFYDVNSMFEYKLSAPISAFIAYTPSNNITDSIMEDFFDHTAHKSHGPIPIDNESFIEFWLATLRSRMRTECIGIIFLAYDQVNNNFNYKIRTNNPKMATNYVPNSFYNQIYEASDFIRVQFNLDKALLRSIGFNDYPNVNSFGMLPKSKQDLPKTIIYWYIYLALGYLIFLVTFVKEILHETCSGIKETMNIIGVSFMMYWFHWLIYSLMLHLPFSFVLALILNKLIPQFSFLHLFILWVIVILYFLNCTLILLVASNLIKKRRSIGFTAIISGWLTFHVMALPLFSVVDREGTFISTVFMVLPLYSFMRVILSISSLSGSGGLLELLNAGTTKKQISVFLSLILSSLELLTLAFILVLMNKKYSHNHILLRYLTYYYQLLTLSRKRELCALPRRGHSRFESHKEGMNVLFDVQYLHKKYGWLTKISAVENISLVIYEGEILALVGQGGAGKTTLLSILSLITRPSSGRIIFRGEDVFNKNFNYYKFLGYCPQRNWYFSFFTVIEHLVFFGIVQGLSKREAFLKGINLLDKLKMSDTKDGVVSKLPVAIRRKLDLALSFMGDSKVIILDEPTSEMDSQTRREVWDILMEERGHRTIVISTENMDEAEVLGDRIAIMDHGRLVCCGSTTFLKTVYKTGYHIGVLTQPDAPTENIMNLVHENTEASVVEIITQTHINIIIKEECMTELPNLVETLESNALDLGISSFYIKCTTMEDVFLKLRDETADEYREEISELSYYNASIVCRTTNKTALAYQRFETLFWKRMLHTRRRIYLFLIMFVVTIITIAVLSYLIQERSGRLKIKLKTKEDYSPLPMNLYMFNPIKSIVTYDINSENIDKIATYLIKKYEGIVISDFKGKLGFENFLEIFDAVSSVLWLTFHNNNNITMRYRGEGHFASAVNNLLSNILLRNFTRTGMIRTINHPLELERKCSMSNEDAKEFLITYWDYLFFPCSVTILIMTFIPFIVEEKVSGFKLQQLFTGVSPALYVTGNFVFDMILYVFTIFICLIIVILFLGNEIGLSYHGYFPTILKIAILYGVNGILKIYLISNLIHNIAFGMLMFFLIEMAYTILAVLFVQYTSITHHLFLVCVLSINPLFATVMALIEVFEVLTYNYMCDVCKDKDACFDAVNSEDEISMYITCLFFDSTLYLFVLLSVEYGLVRKIYVLFRNEKEVSKEETRDADVQAEIDKVKNLIMTDEKDMPLKVDGLVKIYVMDKKSVNNVSFCVSKGECFGLLGVAGTGKTTVLKILAGDISSNRGVSVINQYDVLKERRKYQQCVGYCPENVALLDVFTGAEILIMICLLKGISRHDTEHEVQRWLQIIDMEDLANKRITDYSSGQKKMLSVAMAFIGNPVVVLLDEPTTGVDPKSRRKIWSVIESCRNAGQAIVLSSSSLTECEALCTRLTVLKDGAMRCIGTPEYLREKFSGAVTVFVRLKVSSSVKRDRLKDEFYFSFPRGIIIDDYENVIHYQIFNDRTALSVLLAELIRIRDKYDIIEHYTVSNTTLEQVFLTLVKTNIVQHKSHRHRSSEQSS